MKSPALLISDMDRTILTHDHALPQRVTEAFVRAKKDELRVVLASARSPKALLPYLDSLNVDGACICFNGGWIGNPRTGESVHNHVIPRELAADVFRYAEALGVTVLWYAGNDVFATQDNEVVTKETGITGEVLRHVKAVQEIPGEPNKIMCVAWDVEGQGQFDKIRNAFSRHMQLSRSHARLLEISPKGVDKAGAAAFVRDALGIAAADTAAAGDAENDLQMLRDVGFPVTVSNALPEIKAFAKFTAASCDEGGIADAVDWLLALRRNHSHAKGLAHA